MINKILNLPALALRIGTQDWHPADHISFASNHAPPNNKPFESHVAVTNPAPGREKDTKLQRLWPVHCVGDTEGATIIPEITQEKLDVLAKKGMDARVEMYSCFGDAFRNTDPALVAKGVNVNVTEVLKAKNVTDVFVVGLAGDYCVKYTALDAARAGFKTWVVEDAIKCVDTQNGWKQSLLEFEELGVSVIRSDGAELARLGA